MDKMTSKRQTDTTIRTRAASVPTDLAEARNNLAIAIKAATSDPTEENLLAVQSAQDAVVALEDQYNVAYRMLLAKVSERMWRDRHVNR